MIGYDFSLPHSTRCICDSLSLSVIRLSSRILEEDWLKTSIAAYEQIDILNQIPFERRLFYSYHPSKGFKSDIDRMGTSPKRQQILYILGIALLVSGIVLISISPCRLYGTVTLAVLLLGTLLSQIIFSIRNFIEYTHFQDRVKRLLSKIDDYEDYHYFDHQYPEIMRTQMRWYDLIYTNFSNIAKNFQKALRLDLQREVKSKSILMGLTVFTVIGLAVLISMPVPYGAFIAGYSLCAVGMLSIILLIVNNHSGFLFKISKKVRECLSTVFEINSNNITTLVSNIQIDLERVKYLIYGYMLEPRVYVDACFIENGVSSSGKNHSAFPPCPYQLEKIGDHEFCYEFDFDNLLVAEMEMLKNNNVLRPPFYKELVKNTPPSYINNFEKRFLSRVIDAFHRVSPPLYQGNIGDQMQGSIKQRKKGFPVAVRGIDNLPEYSKEVPLGHYAWSEGQDIFD